MAAPSAADIFPYRQQNGGAPFSPAWGPPEGACNKAEEEQPQKQASLLEVLPFDLNLKSSLFSQQLFRCCDFTFNSKQRDGRGVVAVDEEREFQTVDSKPVVRHKGAGEGWLSRRRPPVKQTTAAFNEKTKEEEELKLGKKAKSDQKKQQQQQQVSLQQQQQQQQQQRAASLPCLVLPSAAAAAAPSSSCQHLASAVLWCFACMRCCIRACCIISCIIVACIIACLVACIVACMQARYARIHARHRAFSEWSIQPTNDWVVLAEVPLQQLHKQQIETPRVTVEDIEWRGTLGVYMKQADKIASKLPVPMQNLSSNFYYYWVTTQDDEVISDYLLHGSKPVDVAATDQVLACLMAAPQSKYSWHLYITKLDGKLIIDKANGSIVDLLTVNETSTEPPMQDAENRLNRPAALGFEAVKINQNLRQQVLVPGEIAASYPPAPFVEADDTPATIAYSAYCMQKETGTQKVAAVEFVLAADTVSSLCRRARGPTPPAGASTS
ncbi:hypothetical protein Efla_002752 [Eimeria flavescens]